ncbi:MAG: hypothetical protein RIR49_2112 [Actinomycetota bacterium]|jgi:hypothetical protein
MARLVLEQRMAARPGGDPNDEHEVFTVLEPFRVGHRLTGVITVPAGRCCFVSDLASVPWFLVWLVGRTGRHLRAAIVHDWLIDRLGHPGSPVVDRRAADRVFLDLMAADGVPLARRRLIHTAVTLASEVVGGGVGRVRAVATVAVPAAAVVAAPWLAPHPWWLVGVPATVASWWGRRGGSAILAMVVVSVLTHVTAAVIAVRSALVAVEVLVERASAAVDRRRRQLSGDGSVPGQSVGAVPGSTSSLVAVVANSTEDGGTKPSTAWKVKCFEPGRSGSSATSTTMISPAENSL